MPINPAPGHFSTSQYKSILFEAKIACIENIAKIQHRQLNTQSHTCHHCDMLIKTFDLWWLNSLRPRRNGRYNADDIFKCIFLKENVCIPTKISLNFVPKGPINNIPALVKIMAWRRPGDKPLSEPMLIFVPTHICVTRPQWVKLSEVPPNPASIPSATSLAREWLAEAIIGHSDLTQSGWWAGGQGFQTGTAGWLCYKGQCQILSWSLGIRPGYCW